MNPTKPATAEGPMRLLHVEDNPADALLMQEYIRGILSAVEFDSAERLADLTPERAADADCAILDLSLPDASGLEALIALRAMSEDLPIIVLTGFDDLEVGLSALRYGADDYLVKSQVDGFTLDRAVKYAVARRRLTLDIAVAAAAATVATASVIMAEVAHRSDVTEKVEDADRSADGPLVFPDAAPGTHRVSVQIDAKSGEYSLLCESCSWEADRGTPEMHSWADRSLSWILLRHVAFGDQPGAALALPPAAMREAEAAAGHGPSNRLSASADDEPPVVRRALVSPQRWLRHSETNRNKVGS